MGTNTVYYLSGEGLIDGPVIHRSITRGFLSLKRKILQFFRKPHGNFFLKFLRKEIKVEERRSYMNQQFSKPSCWESVIWILYIHSIIFELAFEVELGPTVISYMVPESGPFSFGFLCYIVHAWWFGHAGERLIVG